MLCLCTFFNCFAFIFVIFLQTLHHSLGTLISSSFGRCQRSTSLCVQSRFAWVDPYPVQDVTLDLQLSKYTDFMRNNFPTDPRFKIFVIAGNTGLNFYRAILIYLKKSISLGISLNFSHYLEWPITSCCVLVSTFWLSNTDNTGDLTTRFMDSPKKQKHRFHLIEVKYVIFFISFPLKFVI